MITVRDPRLETVETLITPAVTEMGYRLVQLRWLKQGRGGTLQIMAERSADGGMEVDDCAAVSRTVSALMDVHDPIPGEYQLEVSSPGVDRPLVRPEDFDTWAGHEAKVEMHIPVEGRKRFRGVVEGMENGDVCIRLPEGERATLSFADIRFAKLVLTDALLAAVTAGDTDETHDSD